MERISLIHTADVHLGIGSWSLGKKGRLMRERLFEALGSAVSTAMDHRVQLFLIAGDLFNSNRKDDRLLERTGKILKRLAEARIPVIIIPGTYSHDGWGPDCILKKGFFSKNPPGIFVLTPDDPTKIFPEIDCAVCGWFAHPDRPEEIILPKEGWHQGMHFRIGMAHGSVLLHELIQDKRMPILPEHIRDSGLDYLALGHWHSLKDKDMTQGQVTAWYSGAPEMMESDDRYAGHVNLVVIYRDKRVDVKELQAGRTRFEEVIFEPGELAAGRSIQSEIEKLKDTDLWLRVIIRGDSPPDFFVDMDSIQEEFEGSFFKLDIVDQTRVLLDEDKLKSFSPNTIAGQFMKGKIDAADPSEQEVLEQALKLGLRRLRGDRG
jgi:exonuclease SbcD